MSCCVPHCETTAENVAAKSKPEGLTAILHDFPSDLDKVNLWRKSLSINDPLPENAKICSLHFVDDDIFATEDGVIQIKDGSIPLPVQFCTMCLDAENKLYTMSKYKLDGIYEVLMGQQECNYKYINPAVCMKCLETLVELNSFRQKSLKSRAVVMQLGLQ